MIAADQHHLEDDNFFPATVYWRMCDVARTLERERNEARALAKYWQEQYGHSNPEHEWQALPWDKEGGPQ